VADVCNNGGNEQVINSTEGVLMAEISALTNSNSGSITLLSNGSNFIKLVFSSTTNRIDFVAFSNGALSCNIVKVITDTTINNKIALKYKENDFALWINGEEVGADSTGAHPLSLTSLNFTNEVLSGSFFGKIKDVRVYTTALTDAELQALTKI